MNRHLFTSRFRLLSLTGLIWGTVGAIAPTALRADVPLTRADVESLYNSVDFIRDGQDVRPATLNDWLNRGDAVRTLENARAELRFNDGSLARIGERATFWFVPNTRDFRLSNGTALLLIPPERGPSNIQTPSAVTGIQGTALVVRHIPQDCDSELSTSGTLPWEECTGRTVVMVLTESPKGPVEVTATNGNTQALSAGNMAIIEGNSIEVLEFNLDLFYRTSPLVEGLNLNNPNYQGEGAPTDPVRRETWDGIQSQEGFEGSHLLNPEVFSVDADLSVTTSWLLPENSTNEFLTADVIAGEGISNIESVGNIGSRSMSGGSMASRVGNSMTNVIIERANLPAGIIDPPPTTRRVTGTTTAGTGGGMGSVSTPRSPSQQPIVTSPDNSNRPPRSTPQPPSTPTPSTPTPSVTPTPPVSNSPNPAPSDPITTPSDPSQPEPSISDPVPSPSDPVTSPPVTGGGSSGQPPTTTPDPIQPPVTVPDPVQPPPTTTPDPVQPPPTTTPEPVQPPPATTPDPVQPPPTTTPEPVQQPPTTTPDPVQPPVTPDPVQQPPTTPEPIPPSDGGFNPPNNPPLNPNLNTPGPSNAPANSPPGQTASPPLQVDPTPSNTPIDVNPTTPDPVPAGVIVEPDGRPNPVAPQETPPPAP